MYFVQKSKLDGTHDAKLRIQLKFNWIFYEFWLLIYTSTSIMLMQCMT